MAVMSQFTPHLYLQALKIAWPVPPGVTRSENHQLCSYPRINQCDYGPGRTPEVCVWINYSSMNSFGPCMRAGPLSVVRLCQCSYTLYPSGRKIHKRLWRVVMDPQQSVHISDRNSTGAENAYTITKCHFL